MPRTSTPPDHSIRTYRSKRDFSATEEPAPRPDARSDGPLSFVVQKHTAHRAGLHWDFRLEHDGVLWSWAVPKGPSLDPADKRMAIHVEDHPLDYADFQGRIPDGQYGAGTVETWDRGTWQPLVDPDEGMRKGDLKFVLSGQRLRGRFTLVRLHGKPGKRQEAWFLIKGHDDEEQPGADAGTLEQQRTLKPRKPRPRKQRTKTPAPGAKKAALPTVQKPQLASISDDPPEGDQWLNEIKLDGYRLLIWLSDGTVRIETRNGLDWTDRLPALAREVAKLDVQSAVLDGELVALRPDGASSFPDLQAALSAGRDDRLFFYIFDLLYLDGWDLRPSKLLDRKAALAALAGWQGMLRYSEHVTGNAAEVLQQACRMKLEGIIAKRATASYRAGRGRDWLKVKCQGREEFIVLGWTPPAGKRTGFGALHLGYYDQQGHLHYAGGVGTGYSERVLTELRSRLDTLASDAPPPLLVAGDPLDRSIQWVRPDLVAEVQYAGWSGAGRVRHAVFLGLREDKTANEVEREIADPDAERQLLLPMKPSSSKVASRAQPKSKIAIPPRQSAKSPTRRATGSIVVATAPKPNRTVIGDIELTHPDRQLWPGITKRDLAEYWQAVAEKALPGLAHRPLAIVRCPTGIGGEHFFQKNGHGYLPSQIREGKAGGSPYLAIDDAAGLIALAQMSAIELHAWGATEADPLHPDLAVFDLDPGEGVAFPDVTQAAHELRDRLQRLNLRSFCRTTGGKGLHVVVPIEPRASWDEVKPWCRAFAELLSQEQPEKYLPTLSKAERRGRILIDWLRNGLGATAVASFCPRARPGALVATPLAWDEVTPELDPATYTIRSIPDRLGRLRKDPWHGFADVAQRLPEPESQSKAPPRRPKSTPRGQSRVVFAPPPKRRARG